MKLLFISDIHGSSYFAKKAIEAFKLEKADYILILGDILYHGARNPLPKDYNPKEVLALLNEYADKIVAVRGNCDSEVDEMVLDFHVSSTFTTVLHNNRRFFLSHGHIFNPENLPKLSSGDVFAYGHTHVPVAELRDGIYILNPGSVTFPKENSPNSYGILEGDVFKVKDFEGNAFKEVCIV